MRSRAVLLCRRGLASTSSANNISCSVIIERRPVIYHIEPWMQEYEKWAQKNRRATYGRSEPKSILTLSNKMAGSSKKLQDDGSGASNEHSVKKKKMDLSVEFESLRRFNVTPDDESNNLLSLRRCLSRRLYLIVRNNQVWRFPRARLSQQETSLRQCAEKIVREGEAKGLEVYWFGNAPVAHWDGEGGEKNFAFSGEIVWGPHGALPEVGQWKSGQEQHAWVTRDMLPQYLQDPILTAALKCTSKI